VKPGIGSRAAPGTGERGKRKRKRTAPQFETQCGHVITVTRSITGRGECRTGKSRGAGRQRERSCGALAYAYTRDRQVKHMP